MSRRNTNKNNRNRKKKIQREKEEIVETESAMNKNLHKVISNRLKNYSAQQREYQREPLHKDICKQADCHDPHCNIQHMSIPTIKWVSSLMNANAPAPIPGSPLGSDLPYQNLTTVANFTLIRKSGQTGFLSFCPVDYHSDKGNNVLLGNCGPYMDQNFGQYSTTTFDSPVIPPSGGVLNTYGCRAITWSRTAYKRSAKPSEFSFRLSSLTVKITDMSAVLYANGGAWVNFSQAGELYEDGESFDVLESQIGATFVPTEKLRKGVTFTYVNQSDTWNHVASATGQAGQTGSIVGANNIIHFVGDGVENTQSSYNIQFTANWEIYGSLVNGQTVVPADPTGPMMVQNVMSSLNKPFLFMNEQAPQLLHHVLEAAAKSLGAESGPNYSLRDAQRYTGAMSEILSIVSLV